MTIDEKALAIVMADAQVTRTGRLLFRQSQRLKLAMMVQDDLHEFFEWIGYVANFDAYLAGRPSGLAANVLFKSTQFGKMYGALLWGVEDTAPVMFGSYLNAMGE